MSLLILGICYGDVNRYGVIGGYLCNSGSIDAGDGETCINVIDKSHTVGSDILLMTNLDWAGNNSVGET